MIGTKILHPTVESLAFTGHLRLSLDFTYAGFCIDLMFYNYKVSETVRVIRFFFQYLNTIGVFHPVKLLNISYYKHGVTFGIAYNGIP